ncbi:hypothetical protein DFH11DRAFT_1730785 [Phellopilus nigrolimitatus]|nr:hypothetical protein DFH11DRAFT_1730785 [Phellopilus nigrolimitatus]
MPNLDNHYYYTHPPSVPGPNELSDMAGHPNTWSAQDFEYFARYIFLMGQASRVAPANEFAFRTPTEMAESKTARATTQAWLHLALAGILRILEVNLDQHSHCVTLNHDQLFFFKTRQPVSLIAQRGFNVYTSPSLARESGFVAASAGTAYINTISRALVPFINRYPERRRWGTGLNASAEAYIIPVIGEGTLVPTHGPPPPGLTAPPSSSSSLSSHSMPGPASASHHGGSRQSLAPPSPINDVRGNAGQDEYKESQCMAMRQGGLAESTPLNLVSRSVSEASYEDDEDASLWESLSQIPGVPEGGIPGIWLPSTPLATARSGDVVDLSETGPREASTAFALQGGGMFFPTPQGQHTARRPSPSGRHGTSRISHASSSSPSRRPTRSTATQQVEGVEGASPRKRHGKGCE